MKLKVMVKQFQIFPRFYLPVERQDRGRVTESWFFAIAPFVLLWKLIRNATSFILRDLVAVLDMWNYRQLRSERIKGEQWAELTGKIRDGRTLSVWVYLKDVDIKEVYVDDVLVGKTFADKKAA